MTGWMIALLVSGLMFAVALVVCVALWIYRDAKSRGLNAWLWTIIAVLTSPFVGWLLYMLAARQEERRSCTACGAPVSLNARFCERCGSRQPPFLRRPSAIRARRYVLTGAACLILMIGCFVSFVVAAVRQDVLPDMVGGWNTGVITMSYETTWDNVWTLRFRSASDGFQKQRTLRLEEPGQCLQADISCEEGELLLHVRQEGQADVTVDVSHLTEPLSLPLEGFKTGKLTVILEIHGARNVRSAITVT